MCSCFGCERKQNQASGDSSLAASGVMTVGTAELNISQREYSSVSGGQCSETKISETGQAGHGAFGVRPLGCSGNTLKAQQCSWLGERARLGRSGPRLRGPHRACGRPNHSVKVQRLGFGARAHRTTAEAAVLPRLLDCIVTAKGWTPILMKNLN